MASNASPRSCPPMANPVAVVGPHFCAPNPVDLIMTQKLRTLAVGCFAVTDVNSNLVFKVKGKIVSIFSPHDRRVLLDAAGNPIISLRISLRQKIFTACSRWKVYRGDSSDSKDLLFSVKKSSLFQFKTKLDVFLAANNKEDVCDFKVEGSWPERSCTIFLGNTSTIIAKMHEKHSVQSILHRKDILLVTVYPHVDYAFIVALVAIFHEINVDRNK